MSLDSSDIILLSSDDECSSPPQKKSKFERHVGKLTLHRLTHLKEITTAVRLDKHACIRKTKIEQNNITIIIPAEKNKCKENGNGVVNLIDESPDNSIATNLKGVSEDCLILGSDSESEGNSENHKESQNSEETKDDKPAETTEKKDTVEENQSIEDKEIVESNGPDVPPEPQIEPESGKTPEEVPIENEDILNRPSTSTASEAHKLLDEFLETCAKSMRGSKYEGKVSPKFPRMKNNFSKCSAIHKDPGFQRMLQEHVVSAKISAPEAVVSFQRIYSYLLDHVNGDSIEVEEKDLLKLKQLEKTCKRLLKRLRVLEEAELNFDDEEDSTYIQIDRYSRRLNQVYGKYCQLLQKSPHAGRLLHEKIQFVSSRHNEINRAITKSYRHNKFPTYYDIEKCVRRCASKHALALSESDIREESKSCFTKMGNLLQMRRKKELYEVHCGFIALNEDPANNDYGLKIRLQDSLQDGERKMKEVVEKYARMQDSNVNVELSEDSDDSEYKETESEGEAEADRPDV